MRQRQCAVATIWIYPAATTTISKDAGKILVRVLLQQCAEATI